MRIDSIDLIRYGHFCDRRLEFLPGTPDFFVIYGDNEAGKSTLLRAISSLFFGVPAKTPDAHKVKPSELRVGATVSNGHECLSFRRRKGNAATLLDPDESPIEESLLAGYLPELDRERFEQFFCLDHVRLREGGEELLKGKGDVGAALFQAAGLLELRKLQEKLDDESKDLFSPKARGRVINGLIEQYRDARATLTKVAISGAEVKKLESEIESAKTKHETLKSEAHTLQQELRKLRRIAANKPDVTRLYELRQALSALESVPLLPASARRDRDRALGTLATAEREIQNLTAQLTERSRRILELSFSPELKARGKEIEELNSQIAQYIASVNDRTKRTTQRAEAIGLAELEWKKVWHSHPVAVAHTLKDAYSRKSELLDLIAEHAGLSAAFDQAAEQLRDAKETQERLGDDLALDPEPPDPAALVATIEAVKALGDTEAATARLKSDIERLTTDAARELKTLAFWTGSIAELEALKIPLPATSDRYAREWETIHERKRTRVREAEALAEQVRQKRAELERYAGKIGKAGESELAEARANRDRLWELIRRTSVDHTITPEEAQLESGTDQPLADAFARQIRLADEIADVRFAYAKEVAVHDRLVREMESSQREQEQMQLDLSRVKEEEEQLQQRWAAEWSGLGFTPLSPPEMKDWLQVRDRIIDRELQARQKQQELSALEDRVREAAAQLRRQMQELTPKTGKEGESLPILIRLAESCAKELTARQQKARDIRQRIQLLQVERRKEKLEECKRKLAEWKLRWAPAVRELLLPEVSSTKEVSVALEVLERVYSHFWKADDLEYRITKIGENIDRFEAQAKDLIQSLDPALSSLAPNTAIAELHERYLKASNAETERNTIERENAADQVALEQWQRRVVEAENTLKNLQTLANCSDTRQLDAVLQASEQKADKQQEYERIAQSLLERNPGSDLKLIEDEASRFEIAGLSATIAAQEDRQKQVEGERDEAAAESGRLSREYERLQENEDSALEAQKAEDALAKIQPAIGQYLRLRIASELLSRAMESYREKHQGPVLQRASELFSLLTVGEHSGLTTTFGDEDKTVLVAVRKNREHVNVDALSDGTRDQMYLALRLAAIEDHVQTVAPCPVIFDDLLINSDDSRSAAALEVIAQLSRRTQVLFFTHHARLAELGSRSGAQVIQLARLAAAAVA